MMLLDGVVAVLDREGIPHALIGASALAAAGVARSTLDIDILVVDASVLNDAIWTGVRVAGGVVDIRRGNADDPIAGIVRVQQSGERPVDIVLGRYAWQARAIDRAFRPDEGPPVVTPRDLILLKLYAGGTQDLWDIRELLRTDDGSLARVVEADLQTLSRAMRDAWNKARGS